MDPFLHQWFPPIEFLAEAASIPATALDKVPSNSPANGV
jgi:hypothetical protein